MIDFRDVITEQVLADYLTAEFGHDLAIWDDGSYEIIESNLRWKSNDNAPCVRIECPGIGNLDSEWFENQYARRDPETGLYFEIETGRQIGYLKGLINETCLIGDVSEWIDDLITACNNQAMDNVYPFKD